MAYLEELLPEFKKGVRIRKNYWDKHQYIYYKDNNIYTHKNMCINLTGDELVADYWELYYDPEPDWQYIIDHKCLCWLWDRDDDKRARFLSGIIENHKAKFLDDNDYCWYYCRPVRRDEVTFYEDKKDD